MNQTMSFCSAAAVVDGRASPRPACRSLMALAGAATIAAAAALLTRIPASPVAALPQTILVHAETPTALRDRVEALRAELLTRPGVRAVTVEGLRQTSLSVDYTPRRLASFGISPAELAAVLPVDAGASRPGHLALRNDGKELGLQDVADLPVRAFRVGDVAAVIRAPLTPPVSANSTARLNILY